MKTFLIFLSILLDKTVIYLTINIEFASLDSKLKTYLTNKTS